MHVQSERAFVAAGVLLALVALLASFRREWGERWVHGWLGGNGARYSATARNLLRHPLSVTGGLPCQAVGELDESGPDPYVRHPPMLTWLVAASFRIFGESEDAARGPAAAATALLAAALALLAARRGSWCAGAVAAAAFALLPMTGYYGTHVDVQGSLVACAVAWAVLGYAWFAERGERAGRVLGCFALTVALWSDWPAWIALALLVLAFLRRGDRRMACEVAGLGVANGAVLLALLFRGSGGSLAPFGEALDQRALSFVRFLRAQTEPVLRPWLAGFDELVPWWSWAVPLLLIVLIPRLHPSGAATAGLESHASGSTVAPGRPDPGPPPRAPFPAGPILFGAGALHVVLFPLGAVVHDYWAHLLAPPVALLAAAAIERVDALARAHARPAARLALRAALLVGGVTGLVRGDRWLEAKLARETILRDVVLADLVRPATPPDARILTNGSFEPFAGVGPEAPVLRYYLDRKLRGGVGDVATFDAAGGAFRPTHFLLLPARLGAATPELIELLDRTARATRFPRVARLTLYDLAAPPGSTPPAAR